MGEAIEDEEIKSILNQANEAIKLAISELIDETYIMNLYDNFKDKPIKVNLDEQ